MDIPARSAEANNVTPTAPISRKLSPMAIATKSERHLRVVRSPPPTSRNNEREQPHAQHRNRGERADQCIVPAGLGLDLGRDCRQARQSQPQVERDEHHHRQAPPRSSARSTPVLGLRATRWSSLADCRAYADPVRGQPGRFDNDDGSADEAIRSSRTPEQLLQALNAPVECSWRSSPPPMKSD
jgi:hypothetical protein